MIGEKHFTSATEFLEALDPSSGELWEANRRSLLEDRSWVFRGMWDAAYKLRPTAFRAGAFEVFRYLGTGGPFPIESPIEQRDREDNALVEFCSEADRLGFHIPGDRPELRDPRLAIPSYDPHQFPPIEKLHMYALAQHYGVPSRLLD